MKMVPLTLTILVISIELLGNSMYSSLELGISSKICLMLSSSFSFNSMVFVIMVSMISTFIMFYSSMYMESYNKKKFLILTMMFFSSMVILSLSEGLTSTMLGWDGLGISSICLIMIYQSKKTTSNSILTMAFNRIGDVFLIIGMVMAAESPCDFSFVLGDNSKMEAVAFLIMASMTKSAQFPLSTWLPAAMSAPTPISAMVHSSTLVTAGVYLMIKLFGVLTNSKMIWIMKLISVTSMVAASIMTTFEKDLKKIIAFSTMSHISIMMFMIGFSMKKLALAHMITHAIFKTSIFMSAGNKFISSWSDQSLNMTNLKNKGGKKFFILSALMLTSLPFTVSFYTKDVILEVTMESESSLMIYTIAMWLVTILTIFYSKTILKSLGESGTFMKSMNLKSGLMVMYASMSMLSLCMSKLSTLMVKSIVSPVVSKTEIMTSLTLMVMSFNLNMSKSKILMFMSTSMMGKTEFTISKIKMIKTIYSSMTYLDFLMMNSTNWVIKEKNVNKFKSSLKSLSLVSMILFMIMI